MIQDILHHITDQSYRMSTKRQQKTLVGDEETTKRNGRETLFGNRCRVRHSTVSFLVHSFYCREVFDEKGYSLISHKETVVTTNNVMHQTIGRLFHKISHHLCH